MGGVGHEHGRARLARCLVDRSDRGHAANLALGAGLGRKRHARHAGEFRQPGRESRHHLQRALNGSLRLQRVKIGKARQPGHFFIEPRVVLHGAGAERVDAHIDRVILLA